MAGCQALKAIVQDTSHPNFQEGHLAIPPWLGGSVQAHLEVFVCEAEQQAAVDAVVHKPLPILTQANVVCPVAHLCHCPVMHIVLHGLLHSCCQPVPACLPAVVTNI